MNMYSHLKGPLPVHVKLQMDSRKSPTFITYLQPVLMQ